MKRWFILAAMLLAAVMRGQFHSRLSSASNPPAARPMPVATAMPQPPEPARAAPPVRAVRRPSPIAPAEAVAHEAGRAAGCRMDSARAALRLPDSAGRRGRLSIRRLLTAALDPKGWRISAAHA